MQLKVNVGWAFEAYVKWTNLYLKIVLGSYLEASALWIQVLRIKYKVGTQLVPDSLKGEMLQQFCDIQLRAFVQICELQ